MSRSATRGRCFTRRLLHWPPNARPVGGHSLLRHRYAKGCVPAPGQYPSGIPHTLHCPHFGVTCQLPCRAGLFLWALRMGEWVRAACTDSVEWSHVMAIGGLTTWVLPGVTVHGPTQVWKWPDEVQSLAGQCGHLFHEGRDPFVCDASKSVLHLIGGTLNGSVYVDRSTSSVHQALKAGALALGAPRPFSLLGGLLLVDLVAGVRSVSDSPEDEEPRVVPHFDSTPPCRVSWCHELACQTTHFEVEAAALHRYCLAASPLDTIRYALWTPFRGPAIFDRPRSGDASVLRSILRDAGHREAVDRLYVAFDTGPNILELVSCPPGDTVWWLVRDGLSRELLRPVAPWYEADGRRVLTLNSLGQAQNAGQLERLPIGVRAVTTLPFSRVLGYLSAAGLVLSEVPLGIFLAGLAIWLSCFAFSQLGLCNRILLSVWALLLWDGVLRLLLSLPLHEYGLTRLPVPQWLSTTHSPTRDTWSRVLLTLPGELLLLVTLCGHRLESYKVWHICCTCRQAPRLQPYIGSSIFGGEPPSYASRGRSLIGSKSGQRGRVRSSSLRTGAVRGLACWSYCALWHAGSGARPWHSCYLGT